MLEHSLGDPCDDELLSANNPRPEAHRDQANQWAEHCESNCDARNYRPGKLLIGRDRHTLQTQFPTSGIELRRRDQLGLQRVHLTNVPNACARSIAGIDPGSAHHGGCSRECDYCADERTECRKPVTCLHANYLKHSETGISDTIENFSCIRCCQEGPASKIMLLMKLWSWQKENLPSIGHSVRTALAATVSVIVARLVQMPEAYWAAIATLVVMQSTLGATLTLSIERVVATALGASVGALESNYFGANLAAFALAIVLIGMLSIASRLEKTAYRYASITLAIIVLIPRSAPAWTIALHRFLEVSVGIIVALAVVALWPEHQGRSPTSIAE